MGGEEVRRGDRRLDEVGGGGDGPGERRADDMREYALRGERWVEEG